LKQSETKDQTERDAKIKGYNYNFSRGLDYKIVKNIQGPNQKYHFEIENGIVSFRITRTVYGLLQKKKRLAIKRQGRCFLQRQWSCFRGACLTPTVTNLPLLQQ